MSNFLFETATCLSAYVELQHPDPTLVATLELNSTALSRTAADDSLVAPLNDILGCWISQIELLLQESAGRLSYNAVLVRQNQPAAFLLMVFLRIGSPSCRFGDPDSGPDSELAFWQDRAGKISSVRGQLKRRVCIALGMHSSHLLYAMSLTSLCARCP
jgi:hypothetical protein